MVSGDRPVSEYLVPVEPVFDTRADQVEPLFVDLSILYPVIAEPPLFAGACHDKVTFPVPALACRFWGADGTPVTVALASLDSGDRPTELTARTL